MRDFLELWRFFEFKQWSLKGLLFKGEWEIYDLRMTEFSGWEHLTNVWISFLNIVLEKSNSATPFFIFGHTLLLPTPILKSNWFNQSPPLFQSKLKSYLWLRRQRTEATSNKDSPYSNHRTQNLKTNDNKNL